MSKALLVMDMPNSCMGCNFLYCDIENNVDSCQAREKSKPIDLEKEDKPDWCPLRPVPDKRPERYLLNRSDCFGNTETYGEKIDNIAIGYNRCIDEILGGVE